MTAPTNPPDFQNPEGASQRPDPAARRRFVKTLSGYRLARQREHASLLAPLSLAAIQRWLDAQLQEWPDRPYDQCLNSQTDASTDPDYDRPDKSS